MREEAARILEENYFRWMVGLIFNPEYMNRNRTWLKLFRMLHDTEFLYTIELDGNRADDGVELRYRFGWEKGYVKEQIAQSLDNRPCSMLEMMVALAHRCEENIMDNPEKGDRTGIWFFEMLESLGLDYADDDHFYPRQVQAVLADFFNHNYAYNGKGGLFTLRYPERDLRRMEIWYQMNGWLIERERR